MIFSRFNYVLFGYKAVLLLLFEVIWVELNRSVLLFENVISFLFMIFNRCVGFELVLLLVVLEAFRVSSLPLFGSLY